MSKPVKEMIIDHYKDRFGDLESAVVIDVRGIDANENNELRIDLQKKAIRITIVKNTLARKAFAGTSLEPLTGILEGPSALAYGGETVVDVARELVEWAKKVENLELKAALLDGELFEGDAGVERLSKFPTRSEALGQVVQLVLTPGGEAVGCAIGPGSQILSIVETIIDKHGG